jgi:hypothetical protein
MPVTVRGAHPNPVPGWRSTTSNIRSSRPVLATPDKFRKQIGIRSGSKRHAIKTPKKPSRLQRSVGETPSPDFDAS